jgi:hypothetical protein
MAAGILDEEAAKLDNEMPAISLGESKRLWKEIKKHLSAECGKLIEIRVND